MGCTGGEGEVVRRAGTVACAPAIGGAAGRATSLCCTLTCQEARAPGWQAAGALAPPPGRPQEAMAKPHGERGPFAEAGLGPPQATRQRAVVRQGSTARAPRRTPESAPVIVVQAFEPCSFWFSGSNHATTWFINMKYIVLLVHHFKPYNNWSDLLNQPVDT